MELGVRRETEQRDEGAVVLITAGPAPVAERRPADSPPAEIVARLHCLQAGGVENILLVDPASTVASLRTFAREVMPAFD